MAFQESSGVIMNIADMNVRITFQKQNLEIDEIGNHSNTWIDYFTCWASAESTNRVSLNEVEAAAQILENDRLNFIVRYCSETLFVNSTEYRILFNSKIYNIDNVDNMDFKKKWLKFKTHLERRS